MDRPINMTGRHLAIPDGFRVRAADPADAEAVAELKRAVDVAHHGDSDVTVDEVREEWALPRLDLTRDVWLVEHRGGGVAGYGFCWVEAPPGELIVEQAVAPEHRGRGLSELLLDLGEARAAELFRAAAPERDGSLGVSTHESDLPLIALFERRGYRHVRTFLRLDRGLGPEVEEPVWPQGIAVATFRRGRDEVAVHAAAEEAFRDHFRPAVMDLEEWLRFRFARDLDLGLWFVAWDGDEVAGAVLAFKTPAGGYLDELFVRRPWRGRGLGRALLLQACAEIRRRGLPLAYLGVDSENPTGALHLYESAGFRSSRGATFVFEKKLTAG
jgi:mycothiol synthase